MFCSSRSSCIIGWLWHDVNWYPLLSESGSKDGGKNREKLWIYCIDTALSHFSLEASSETFCEVVALFSFAAVLHLLKDMKVFWTQTMCKAQKMLNCKSVHTPKISPNPHKIQYCLVIYWTLQKCFLYKKNPISQRSRKANLDYE